ncbi:hypothetical protein CH063_13695 [Colletotrichum higginsianum]|uniref:Uncharacterized protein n=1 Tax=Colletotrichum higginsianum (strain IMI 349063) TaxID=759273 RepID=H1VVH2_COLHI|nr:hypothetical protein CH063_13695 [Colletotrichum higginsianum]
MSGVRASMPLSAINAHGDSIGLILVTQTARARQGMGSRGREEEGKGESRSATLSTVARRTNQIDTRVAPAHGHPYTHPQRNAYTDTPHGIRDTHIARPRVQQAGMQMLCTAKNYPMTRIRQCR